ncbi:MAG: ATP-binding protein [Nitrospirota bacterium]
MRRIFLVIMLFYLFITTAGILFMGARLIVVKERVESLTEAQKSLIKRAEFKDVIFELDKSIERSNFRAKTKGLIERARNIVSQCYGCHHPQHIMARIENAERLVNELVIEMPSKDFARQSEKLLATTNQIIPFVEAAYERATYLANARLKSATQELQKAKNIAIVIILLGLSLFIVFSTISLLRVSTLESKVKERETALRDWAEQWQHTFDSIQDMVLILDRDCRVQMMNDAAKRMYGRDAVGKGIFEILGESFVSECKDVYKSISSMEISIGDRVFSFRTFPRLINNKETGCVIVVKDITAEKEMELRLIQAEKLSVLARTITGVAHELYKPLTAVSEYSELLIDIASIHNGIREVASKINISTARMSNIVGDLFLFSRVPVLEKNQTDVRSLVDKTVQLVREVLETYKIRTCIEIDDTVVFIDKIRMERVLVSLITNAIHRISDSGKGDKIHIKAHKRNGWVIIEISDNGPSIPRHLRQRMFDPHFTFGEIGKGAGLDLSISYNIVKAHGGDITVRGSGGNGTTFMIELPIN